MPGLILMAPVWNVFSIANPRFLVARGNEIAWEYRHRPDVAQFLRAQHGCMFEGAVVGIVYLVRLGSTNVDSHDLVLVPARPRH